MGGLAVKCVLLLTKKSQQIAVKWDTKVMAAIMIRLICVVVTCST